MTNDQFRSKSAVVNRCFEDGGCADGFETFHDVDHFTASHHDLDRAPLRIFQSADGGRIETGGDLFRGGEALPRDVIFEQGVAASDDDAFETPDDAIGHFRIARLMVLDQNRFVSADFCQHAEPIGGEGTACFHEVHDGIGHTQRDHDLDGAGEGHEVDLGRVSEQVLGGDVRKTGRQSAARQFLW